MQGHGVPALVVAPDAAERSLGPSLAIGPGFGDQSAGDQHADHLAVTAAERPGEQQNVAAMAMAEVKASSSSTGIWLVTDWCGKWLSRRPLSTLRLSVQIRFLPWYLHAYPRRSAVQMNIREASSGFSLDGKE